MIAVKRQLEEIIDSAVRALGYRLAGCQMLQSGGRTILQVYVEGENGIDIEVITQISRQISAVLEVEEPIAGRYTLEVSSPGLDRPLFRQEDYSRFVGKPIKLRLRVPRAGSQRNFRGVLVSVKDEQIVLEMDQGEQIIVKLEEIEKANLIPEI